MSHSYGSRLGASVLGGGLAAGLVLAGGLSAAQADMEAAKKWVENEFQPSALSKEEQMKEMEWSRTGH